MSWEDLNIKEKSDLMRLYISNGIMDLDTIKEHYNAFQDGGNVKMPRGYKVSSKLMKIAQRQIDKDAALQSSDYEPDNGMPQATFLMNRKNQQKAFEQYGYTRLNNSEYGPVTNAVTNSPHKDIPVYQKYPDVDVDRDNLQKIGTFLDNASAGETDIYKGPQDSYLPDPAYFPVDVYIDRKTGKVYNQGWDFNDYHNTGKAYGASRLKNIAGNLLDRIGSPTVVTTGLQAHPYYSAEADNYIQDKTNGLLHYEMNPATGDYEIMLPSVTVTAKGTNPVSKSNVELRPASELNEEEFWDMMEANSKQNGGHLYQDGGDTNNKSDWAKAHETELALQQLGWDNPGNRLHSDYAAKDDEGYYAGYNLKPVIVRPSVQQQLRDWGKNNPKAYGIVEQFDPEAVKFNNQWGLGLWAILAGAKAPELIKDATVKGFETLNKVYNPTKWYGAGLTAATAAKPLVDLTSTSNYTDENGRYHTGNTWNNINNWVADAVFASPAFNAGKQGVKAATDAFKYNTTLGRNMTITNELRKGINGSTLTTAPVENAVHNRFRLGDVEINDPNLMYRQTDGRALGEVASGGNRHTMFNRGSLWYGIPTESMLNPVIEPKTVGKLKLTKPNSEVAKTHLLVTRNADMTGANQKFGRVSIGPHSESSLHLNIEKSPEDRWLNEMIREWRNKNSEPGIATYVTDGGSRRVPLEGALNNSNTSIYTFDSGYGYRRIQEPIPTLEQAYQEAINNQQKNPIVFARSLADEGLDNVLRDNYLEGSPSFALTKYSNDNLDRLSELYANNKGITFLFGKNAAGNNAKYFVGDADTPIRQDAARALNLPATEEAINNITPEQVMLGKRILHKDINSTPINWREAFNLTRENNFGGMDYFYNEVLLDKILDYRDAIGAIVNTNKPQYIKMLEDLGIPYGYNLTDIPFNFKGFQQGGSLGKVTPYGQWQYPHQITTIPSNNITMKGVNYPVLGVSNTGDTKMMFPNLDYTFNGNYVTEYPIN